MRGSRLLIWVCGVVGALAAAFPENYRTDETCEPKSKHAMVEPDDRTSTCSSAKESVHPLPIDYSTCSTTSKSADVMPEQPSTSSSSCTATTESARVLPEEKSATSTCSTTSKTASVLPDEMYTTSTCSTTSKTATLQPVEPTTTSTCLSTSKTASIAPIQPTTMSTCTTPKSANVQPTHRPPKSHGPAPSPSIRCVNSPSDRQCWGEYNIDTNYYETTPDTGETREVIFPEISVNSSIGCKWRT
jgi:hypothetical protein